MDKKIFLLMVLIAVSFIPVVSADWVYEKEYVNVTYYSDDCQYILDNGDLYLNMTDFYVESGSYNSYVSVLFRNINFTETDKELVSIGFNYSVHPVMQDITDWQLNLKYEMLTGLDIFGHTVSNFINYDRRAHIWKQFPNQRMENQNGVTIENKEFTLYSSDDLDLSYTGNVQIVFKSDYRMRSLGFRAFESGYIPQLVIVWKTNNETFVQSVGEYEIWKTEVSGNDNPVFLVWNNTYVPYIQEYDVVVPYSGVGNNDVSKAYYADRHKTDFVKVGNYVYFLHFNTTDNTILYLWRSSDYGSTWSDVIEVYDGAVAQPWDALCYNPTTSTFYVAYEIGASVYVNNITWNGSAWVLGTHVMVHNGFNAVNEINLFYISENNQVWLTCRGGYAGVSANRDHQYCMDLDLSSTFDYYYHGSSLYSESAIVYWNSTVYKLVLYEHATVSSRWNQLYRLTSLGTPIVWGIKNSIGNCITLNLPLVGGETEFETDVLFIGGRDYDVSGWYYPTVSRIDTDGTIETVTMDINATSCDQVIFYNRGNGVTHLRTQRRTLSQFDFPAHIFLDSPSPTLGYIEQWKVRDIPAGYAYASEVVVNEGYSLVYFILYNSSGTQLTNSTDIDDLFDYIQALKDYQGDDYYTVNRYFDVLGLIALFGFFASFPMMPYMWRTRGIEYVGVVIIFMFFCLAIVQGWFLS